MREITDKLYIGGYTTALDRGEEFDEIISLAEPNEHTTHTSLFDDGEHQYEDFESVVNEIIKYLDNNQKTLVHCRAGMSRSVGVCIAVSVCYYNMNLYSAINKCQFGNHLPGQEILNSTMKYIRSNNDFHKNEIYELLDIIKTELSKTGMEDNEIQEVIEKSYMEWENLN